MDKRDAVTADPGVRDLQVIGLITLAWVVLLSLLPDFAMRVTKHTIPWLSSTTWGIGMILVCVFAARVFVRVRREHYISALVCVGISLLAVSETFRVVLSTGLLASPLIHERLNELRALDNLLNGLGLVLISMAFFYAILEILASRQQLIAEHARLSAEVAHREQVESNLRAREALLNGISASALDAIIVMGNTGCVTYWNASAERILGYTAEEAIGKSVHGLLAPTGGQMEFAKGAPAWRDTGEGPVVGKTVDLTAVTKAGNEIDVELSVSSVRISGQWHAVGILRDVTQRKRAEEDHRTILQTAMDGFWITDRDGRILDVNDAYCRLSGYTRRELLEMSIADLDACGTREEIAAHMRLIRLKGVDRFEARHRRKDGTLIDVEVSANGMAGESGRQFVFIRDITERKKADDAVRASESKYHALVEATATGYLILDREGRVMDANPEYIRLAGRRTLHDILGRSVLEWTADAQKQRNAGAIAQCLRDGYIRGFVVDYVDDTGRITPVEINASLIVEDGSVSIVSLCRDIGERKRAEQLLEEQRVKMIESARLSSLGIMAGSIAHEINNPLAVVAGCAEQLEHLLAAAKEVPENAATLLGMVRRNSNRIQRIIQGLRELSRDGSADPFAAAHADGIISDVLELCQERFRLHGVSIENTAPANTLTIECRPSQLCQVLLNLLNNSLYAVEKLRQKWIRIDVAGVGDFVEIGITDSGAGIPKEIADQIFAPFFTTKSEQHGLGLGLSISRSIVQTHHGDLLLDAGAANTRFVIRLPKQQPVPANDTEP